MAGANAKFVLCQSGTLAAEAVAEIFKRQSQAQHDDILNKFQDEFLPTLVMQRVVFVVVFLWGGRRESGLKMRGVEWGL
uniref:Uncharacterized protein n=1 Tax=Chromera velia CCMP2878 TaxID=1169474 RepID=A0A0G4F7T4_9ALVE|eukprot:Cvel_15460.t1-p1 / transcript=Cvel_15460.t1 / gene=Cvel_15460 / organism=Chromera_velia_CCMP2878 / gene_product=hypothetical protein / transcript_product=hypothetical protein / location=Cvel_scaffold1145:35960-36270(+) / protein_length=78 / sequence_SO=supercontig / SO=protein_coding / is_pseudo=false